MATRKARSSADVKLQRWIDLLAALLTHRYGRNFAELRRDVPAYAAAARTTSDASLLRMFERDKDELRAAGIPIETRGGSGDEETRYYVDARELYLPFIALAGPTARRARGVRAGYRSVPTLSFEPDELHAVLRAVERARELGDAHLTSQCDSARRKLTLDLPDLAPARGDEGAIVVPRRDGNAASLRELGGAMLRSKRVRFAYHAIGSDATTARTVEPYGLFLQSGHWYLVGRDVAKDAVRNFRVARITDVRANTSKPQSVDYTIPRTFRLAAHAGSRKAWELGDGDAEEAVVEFRGAIGAVKAAMKLGAPTVGAPRRRRFQVRRIDVFARWLLSFAGDAVPVAPAQLVDAYTAIVAQTLRVYDGAAS